MPRRSRSLVAILIAVIPLGVGRTAIAEPARWHPALGTTFQWQLQGTIDTTVDADVFDVDMFDVPRSVIDELHETDRRAICYISAGSHENWRPDEQRFPRRVLGRPLDGWPGERWLDVRRLDVLRPIMRARLDRCAAKGFDGVEFDNVDAYANRSGFPLTKRHQLRYLSFLSDAARHRGLAAGLKNLPQLARRLEPRWDFAVNEQCFQYSECGSYSAFIDTGKPVFQVEYELARSEFCTRANAMGFTSMRKRYSLRAWRRPCWE